MLTKITGLLNSIKTTCQPSVDNTNSGVGNKLQCFFLGSGAIDYSWCGKLSSAHNDARRTPSISSTNMERDIRDDAAMLTPQPYDTQRDSAEVRFDPPSEQMPTTNKKIPFKFLPYVINEITECFIAAIIDMDALHDVDDWRAVAIPLCTLGAAAVAYSQYAYWMQSENKHSGAPQKRITTAIKLVAGLFIAPLMEGLRFYFFTRKFLAKLNLSYSCSLAIAILAAVERDTESMIKGHALLIHKQCSGVQKLIYLILELPLLFDLIDFAYITMPLIGAIIYVNAILSVPETINTIFDTGSLSSSHILLAICCVAAFAAAMTDILIQTNYNCKKLRKYANDEDNKQRYIEAQDFWYKYGDNPCTNFMKTIARLVKSVVNLSSLVPLAVLSLTKASVSSIVYLLMKFLPVTLVIIFSRPIAQICLTNYLLASGYDLLERKQWAEHSTNRTILTVVASIMTFCSLCQALVTLQASGISILKKVNRVSRQENQPGENWLSRLLDTSEVLDTRRKLRDLRQMGTHCLANYHEIGNQHFKSVRVRYVYGTHEITSSHFKDVQFVYSHYARNNQLYYYCNNTVIEIEVMKCYPGQNDPIIKVESHIKIQVYDLALHHYLQAPPPSESDNNRKQIILKTDDNQIQKILKMIQVYYSAQYPKPPDKSNDDYTPPQIS